MFTIHDLVLGISEPLASLGMNNFKEFMDPANDPYLITWVMFKVKFRNNCRQEHAHTLICLGILLSTPSWCRWSDQDITPDVARQVFKSKKGHTPTDRKRILRPLNSPRAYLFIWDQIYTFTRTLCCPMCSCAFDWFCHFWTSTDNRSNCLL